METTQRNGMRNPNVDPSQIQLVSKLPVGLPTQNRFMNRKVPLYMHGVLKPPAYPAGGLVSNIAAVRGVLPCQEAPFSRIKLFRRPPVSSQNGMQVPTGAFRGQNVGIMTQFPILKTLPTPVTNYR